MIKIEKQPYYGNKKVLKYILKMCIGICLYLNLYKMSLEYTCIFYKYYTTAQ